MDKLVKFIKALIVVVAAAMLCMICKDYYKDYKDDIVYRELEDWQKKEVDEGRYDSYNFEEEELEEDDYYSEDDK